MDSNNLAPPSYSHIISSSKSNTELIRDITIAIASTSFYKPSRRSSSNAFSPVHIYKSKAYDIYAFSFRKITQQYRLDLIPMSQSHFGKVIMMLYNCRTKRIGSRNKSYYVYNDLDVVENVRKEYDTVVKKRWIEGSVEGVEGYDRGRKSRTELLRFLKDERCENGSVLDRCNSILANFENFDVLKMRKAWKSIDIEQISREYGGLLLDQFDIMDIFNVIPVHLEVKDVEMTKEMNHLKINLINKSMEILRYKCASKHNYLVWQYLSTRVLGQLTYEKSSSFGSFWILKCLFDEMIPFIQKITN